MLPKKNRLDKKSVNLLFKEGNFVVSPHLSLKFILTGNQTPPRISFIAPKSVAKLAVKRNELRRRGYDALREHMNEFPPGVSGAFIFRKPINSTLEIEEEIKIILNKFNEKKY